MISFYSNALEALGEGFEIQYQFPAIAGGRDIRRVRFANLQDMNKTLAREAPISENK